MTARGTHGGNEQANSLDGALLERIRMLDIIEKQQRVHTTRPFIGSHELRKAVRQRADRDLRSWPPRWTRARREISISGGSCNGHVIERDHGQRVPYPR